MPTRLVREGFISSARINALSMGAEVLYHRLMLIADDYGRYHGSVVTLRGACWPTNPDRISDKDVSKWLNELLRGDNPLVRTYSVAGATYLEIQNFQQRTRSESRFPNPPWLTNDGQLTDKCPQPADNPRTNDRPMRRRYSETETQCEGEGERRNPQTASLLEMPKPTRFDELWSMWPRKMGRAGAEAAWAQYECESQADAVMECARRYLDSGEVKDGAIMYLGPSTKALGWITLCAAEKWTCDWPKARDSPRRESKGEARIAVAAERLRQEELRGEI